MFFLLASVFFGGGCGPLDTSSVDEKKEAHYLAGKKYLQNRKPEKALQAFEKSLLVIPDSAEAHFQLASLHLEEFQNPVRAIYHFEKMLRLREDHPMAEVAKESIDNCKKKIAREVAPLPGSTRTSEEINRLLRENKELEEDKEKLKGKVSQLQGEIGKLKLSLNSMAAPRSSPPNSGGENLLAGQNSPPPAVNRSLPTVANPPKPPENRRFIKHILDQGDSFYALARKYGSSAKAIQRANPSMHPKRLQIGAVVNIPLSLTFTASTQ